MTELLPCPFCGGEASAEGMSGNNVGCNDAECPGYPINCSSHAWNARAALSAERERAKGLVGALNMAYGLIDSMCSDGNHNVTKELRQIENAIANYEQKENKI